MLRKVSELIEHLNTLDPNEEIVDLIWSRADVEYVLAEIQSNNEEGVSQEDIERFDIDEFWENINIDIDHDNERQIEHWNDELYWQVLAALRQEDTRG